VLVSLSKLKKAKDYFAIEKLEGEKEKLEEEKNDN